MQSTSNSKLIKAPIADVFSAFASATAIEKWQAPEGMTGKIHHFDFRKGGSYEMSLYYSDRAGMGKSSGDEDRFTTKFVDIIPNEKIIQKILFDSPEEKFKEEMTMVVTFESAGNTTLVTIDFSNIPSGIKPEDNEEGTRQSLEKLAKFIETKKP